MKVAKIYRLMTLVGSVASCFLVAQNASAPPPEFAQYKAEPAFSGKPAVPQMNTPNARRFRTVIRDGAVSGPNFDGRYTIVEWGCGAACAQFSIVDAKTGRVYDPPFQSVSFASMEQGFVDDGGIRYKLSSSLLVISGCPDEKDCAVWYYTWNGQALRLIEKRTPKMQYP